MLQLRTYLRSVRCGKLTNAPAYEREFLMSEPTFDCCIWQRGARWHWQCMNDLEQVLASGIAESYLAARIAAVSHCLQRACNPSRPH